MQAGIFGSLRSWIWLAGSFVMLVAVLTIFVLLGRLPAGTLILIIVTFGTLVLADFVARLIGDDIQAGFLMLFLLILGLILLFVFPVEGRRAAEASIMLLDGALALFITRSSIYFSARRYLRARPCQWISVAGNGQGSIRARIVQRRLSS